MLIDLFVVHFLFNFFYPTSSVQAELLTILDKYINAVDFIIVLVTDIF